jgi:hypothetical protein
MTAERNKLKLKELEIFHINMSDEYYTLTLCNTLGILLNISSEYHILI